MTSPGSTASAPGDIEELVGVYDADGGLFGELRYVAARTVRRAHCSLCSLTHATLRRRPGWDQLVERLGIPVTLVHRNERDAEVFRTSEGNLPCVLARRGGTCAVLLGPDELDACGHDLAELERRLRSAIARS